jgi:GNAT superfamily N-acetyltransferase
MTQTYGIRPMGRDDLKDAQALIAAVDLFPPDLVAEMAAPALSGASADLWWIADGGKALAYAVPERMTEGTWNLLLLAVDPAVQGQGLGRALVAAVETKLRKMNARLLSGFAKQKLACSRTKSAFFCHRRPVTSPERASQVDP